MNDAPLPHFVRAWAGAALVAALVLAGCGPAPVGDGPSAAPSASQPAPSSDPGASETDATTDTGENGGTLCDQVPIEEVELALGGTTDGGVADDSILTGGTTCRFTVDDERILDVSTSEQSRDEWFDAIEIVGLTDEEVIGIGDEAYRAAGTALGGPGARFTAWADGREVGVTVYSDADQEVAFAAAEAIAQAVLAAGD
jgi:hypothetical protein